MVVKDVAGKLADLITQQNSVELHFIPSHTNNISQSDDIDKLAKQAAINGEEVDHDPLLSSYRVTFKKFQRDELETYVQQKVKPSSFSDYPDRRPSVTGI